ncbi:hypothetical protein [Neosynechococcus sphagnicola]|uniref:hypothetical protein n=1 Tax=Neosynechococcus sphagnicola TaxID=1501145 RepID=UPI00068A3118|nr:hypothetical protein [Neosynechococcus sphagnicola]
MMQPDLRQQAKQGDAAAIAQLMNRVLQPQGVKAHVRYQGEELQVILEADQVPDQRSGVAFVHRGLTHLQIPTLKIAEIQGRQIQGKAPPWAERIALLPPSSMPSEPQWLTQGRSHLQRWGLAVSTDTRPDPTKLVFMLVLAIYGFMGAWNPSYDGPFQFLHGVNLFIHEGGHVLFILGGEFLYFLGGSLTQILLPLMFTGYFLIHRQHFASAVALFWTAQNFMDVSVYIKDARLQALPLLGGENVTHDWNYLLGQLHLLEQDLLLGSLCFAIGVLLYLLSVIAGFYYARSSQ